MMSDSSETLSSRSASHAQDDSGVRQKKLWRNLFLLNLALSLLLVALFWIPEKVRQLDNVFEAPSVNEHQKGVMDETGAPKQEKARDENAKNLLPTRFVTVNASSEKDWAYFDFSRGQEVRIVDRSSLEWDLAFRRGKILSNSGATNKVGGGGLVDLGDVDFDQVTAVPVGGYIADQPSRTEPESPVLLKWYSYNYLSHKLTPKKNVYALRTADGKYAKLQFIGFYCANKEAGCVKMRYVYQDDGTPGFAMPESPAGTPAVEVKP